MSRPVTVAPRRNASGGFYKGTVADKAARSHMNLTFLLPSEELTDKFVKEMDDVVKEKEKELMAL